MLFLDDPEWTPPQDYPELSGTIALDTETRDPLLLSHGPGWCFPNQGEIVGVAIATDQWSSYYPIAHKGGGNLPKEHVLPWLREQLKKPDLKIVMHNSIYDLGWLSAHDIEVKGTVYDTMTAAPLIDENRMSYALDALGKTYLNERKLSDRITEYGKHFGLKNPKGEMWKLPAPYVGEYAEQDAAMTLRLWHKFKDILDEQDLWNIFNLEMNLQPVLLAMRKRGVRVDEEAAHNLVKELKRKEEDIQVQIKKECGHFIDVWAANDIAKAFDARGVSYPRTGKTNAPSFTQKWLDAHEDPLAKLIVKARKTNKNRTTFVEGYVLGHVYNGRIHCELAPLKKTDDGGGDAGTVTGRFSCFSPNLQNLPSLDKDRESGLMIRSLFLPEEGEKWAAIDYSQQEPRLTIHFAYLAKCTGADVAVQKYIDNSSTDYHSLVAELTGLHRKQAKVINLGLAYGMGGAKLCRGLGLPTKWIENWKGEMIEVAGEEGQNIIDRYNENAPFIKELFSICSERAERRGFIKTICGRRRRFKNSNGGGFAAFPHKAMNALIQGSAADQVKVAMINMFKEGIIPLVTVHDEIGISTDSREFTKKCSQIMLDAIPLVLPMKVDAEVGLNWGHANETKGED